MRKVAICLTTLLMGSCAQMATTPTTPSLVGAVSAASTVAAVAVTPNLTLTVQGPISAGNPAYFVLDGIAGTAKTIIMAFGDGTSITLLNSGSTKVTHIYKLPGMYAITVSATDAAGQTASATSPVVVN